MNTFLKISFVCLFLNITALSYADQGNARCCDDEFPKIIVQGTAKIETPADKAFFNIKLRQEDKKLDKAFEKSTEKINAISKILANYGIKKESIQNQGYTYNPLYEGKAIFSSLTKPTSYEVIYNLKVTVFPLDNLGLLFTALSDISETSILGLTYTSSNIDELKRSVLKDAAADAKQKALKLAEGAGASLGKVLRINSNAQESFAYQAYDRNMGMAKAMAETSVAPQVESGSIEVSGNCEVIYLLQ